MNILKLVLEECPAEVDEIEVASAYIGHPYYHTNLRAIVLEPSENACHSTLRNEGGH